MKLLMILFVCLCVQQTNPPSTEKEEKKVVVKTKKEKKASFNKLAPSILIINY